MPMTKRQVLDNGIYHILNKGPVKFTLKKQLILLAI